MAKAAKLAISLPSALLIKVERERKADDKSRSEFTVQDFLKNRRK